MIDQLAQAPNTKVEENPIRDFPDLAVPEKQEKPQENSEQINQLHLDPAEIELKEEEKENLEVEHY